MSNPGNVPGAPETLVLEIHRDRARWWQSVWLRRLSLLIPAALVAAALLNVFGQRPVTTVAVTPAGKLTVYAPVHGRSGLIYAARFRIDARRNLKQATLVLDSGWAEGYTINGAAPQPLTQGSANGKLEFGFGHIATGQHLTFWLSLQINPTNVGHHAQDVSLYDGTILISRIERSITIYP